MYLDQGIFSQDEHKMNNEMITKIKPQAVPINSTASPEVFISYI